MEKKENKRLYRRFFLPDYWPGVDERRVISLGSNGRIVWDSHDMYLGQSRDNLPFGVQGAYVLADGGVFKKRPASQPGDATADAPARRPSPVPSPPDPARVEASRQRFERYITLLGLFAHCWANAEFTLDKMVDVIHESVEFDGKSNTAPRLTKRKLEYLRKGHVNSPDFEKIRQRGERVIDGFFNLKNQREGFIHGIFLEGISSTFSVCTGVQMENEDFVESSFEELESLIAKTEALFFAAGTHLYDIRLITNP